MAVGRARGSGRNREGMSLEGVSAGEGGDGEEDVLCWCPAGFVAVGERKKLGVPRLGMCW